MRDATTLPFKEVSASGMGQRLKHAVIKGALIWSRKEVTAKSMGQTSLILNAVMRDVTTYLGMEGSVLGMERGEIYY